MTAFTRLLAPVLAGVLPWLGWADLSSAAASAASAQNAQRFSGIDRVIAFGDVHGAHDSLEKMLIDLQVIDSNGRWIAGTTHLVSLGDVLDRGPASRAVLDLLIDLQGQALAQNGRVHLVLGNHETMNLSGDLRYVSAEEYAAFAEDESAEERQLGKQNLAQSDPELASTEAFDQAHPPGYFAHRRAFAADGVYGRWLLEQPMMIVINDTAFVHGGLPSWLSEMSLAEVNERAHKDTARILVLGSQLVADGVLPAWQDFLTSQPLQPPPDELTELRESPLLNETSPNWYRGTASCHRLIESPHLEAALSAMGASRVVVGHTPTSDRRIQSRFEGRAILADTGMLYPYYRGRSSAVLLERESMTVLYPGEEQAPQAPSRPPVDVRTDSEQSLLDALNQFDSSNLTPGNLTTIELDGVRHTALLESGDTRSVSNRLAAYRLDKLLGLGLVAPVIERRVKGGAGTLTLLPADSISETERQNANQYRPNPCDSGADYQLMYAFDTLIGNNDRSGDRIVYDPKHWLLYLTGHDQTFGTGTSEPRYLTGNDYVLPPAFARRLVLLEEIDYAQALAGWTGKRQIRALMARSRLLLERGSIPNLERIQR